MYPIVFYEISSSSAIAMKNELISDGLMIDSDFYWRYQPAHWDNFSHEPHTPRFAIFYFKNESLAVFYKLKWA